MVATKATKEKLAEKRIEMQNLVQKSDLWEARRILGIKRTSLRKKTEKLEAYRAEVEAQAKIVADLEAAAESEDK